MVLAAVAIYRGDPAEARTTLQPAVAREEFRDELRVSRLRLMQGWLAAVEGDTGASLAILRPLVAAAANDIGAWRWSPPWMRTFAGIGLAANDDRFAQATAAIAELGARRNPGVPTMAGVALQVRGLLEQDAHVLGQAVDVLHQGPRPLLLAQALADHAAALRAAGGIAAADARMGEAVAGFDALGAVPGRWPARPPARYRRRAASTPARRRRAPRMAWALSLRLSGGWRTSSAPGAAAGWPPRSSAYRRTRSTLTCGPRSPSSASGPVCS